MASAQPETCCISLVTCASLYHKPVSKPTCRDIHDCGPINGSFVACHTGASEGLLLQNPDFMV